MDMKNLALGNKQKSKQIPWEATYQGKRYLVNSEGCELVRIVGEIIRGGRIKSDTPPEELANKSKGEIGIDLEVPFRTRDYLSFSARKGGPKAYYVYKKLAPEEAEKIIKGYNALDAFGKNN